MNFVNELSESEPIEESEKHKITIVETRCLSYSPEKMYKLYIKAKDKWFSFRRATYASYGLRELQSLAERYDPKEGFFCTHGVGRPLKEFDDREDGLKALPLEPFTSLTNQGAYWSFGGNHKNYSGAFGYKIFSQNLASWVYEILQCEDVRAPPNRYHPKLYPVELDSELAP